MEALCRGRPRLCFSGSRLRLLLAALTCTKSWQGEARAVGRALFAQGGCGGGQRPCEGQSCGRGAQE